MNDFNPKHYAQKVLNLTRNRAGNDTYPLPVKHLRNMANTILEHELEKDALPPLTDVETAVLAAVKQDFAQGKQPTIRTVGDRLGYKSPSAVKAVIDRLIRHGYLKREGSKKQIVVVNTAK